MNRSIRCKDKTIVYLEEHGEFYYTVASAQVKYLTNIEKVIV